MIQDWICQQCDEFMIVFIIYCPKSRCQFHHLYIVMRDIMLFFYFKECFILNRFASCSKVNYILLRSKAKLILVLENRIAIITSTYPAIH